MSIPQHESETIEFKLASDGQLSPDIWEVITAFANAEGGIIYFGYNEQGQPIGIPVNKIDQLQQQIITTCSSEFNHPIYPSIEILHNTLTVYIPPSPATERPIFSKKRGLPKGAKVRVGSVNTQVDEIWIRRFSMASQGGAEQIYFDIYSRDTLDNERIQNYLKIVTAKRGKVYQNLTQEDILKKLRIITRSGKVTLLGLLVFGHNNSLQELTAPTTNIAITQYIGTSKSVLTNLSSPSLDDKEFNGNVIKQFSEALKYILSKLPIRSHVDSSGIRQDYLAVPEVAVREILANAIAHRDYSTFGGRVQIDIYSDRIEFCSPGRSLVPLNELSNAPSNTRNPLLLSFLRDLGIAEQRGRGIITIRNSLKDAGLAEPTFLHKHDWFVATLFTSAFINNIDQEWLSLYNKYHLNDRQLKTLVYLKHNPEGVSNSEYCAINNMYAVGDDRCARHELSQLLSLKLIIKQGERKQTKYILI